jgi:hypothetical protein
MTVAALWFVSSWMTYGLIAYFLGLPDGGGAIVGLLLGAFVFMDPTGLLWVRSDLASTEPTRAQPHPADRRRRRLRSLVRGDRPV